MTVVRRPRPAGSVRGVGQLPERGRQIPQRAGLEGVDPALSGALGGDDPGPFQRLQVLGRLWLPRLGELGEDADGAGPFGQQAYQAPAGRVGQCDEERVCVVHADKYSPSRIFSSRNIRGLNGRCIKLLGYV